MSRLSCFVFATLFFVMVLSVPVFAFETVFQFEIQPSVQFLPAYDSFDEDTSIAIYEGFLPAGEYQVSFVLENGVFLAEDIMSFSYAPLDELGGQLGFHFVSNVFYEDSIVPLDLFVIYLVEEQQSVCYCFLSQSPFSLGTDGFVEFTEVASESISDPLPFKDVIFTLFGPYEQQTETITQTLADGSTVTTEQRIPGIAGLDYEWFASVGLFALVLLSFFRLLGGLIKQ